MKIYSGIRWHDYNPATSEPTSAYVGDESSRRIPLRSYFLFKNRFYDMLFDWGEGALGFAGTNLSASILADHFGTWTSEKYEPIPVEIIKAFLLTIVSKFPYKEWEIDSDEIQDFIEEYAEAQIEMVERFENDEANLDVEVELTRLYPMAAGNYMPEHDEYRGVDN